MKPQLAQALLDGVGAMTMGPGLAVLGTYTVGTGGGI